MGRQTYEYQEAIQAITKLLSKFFNRNFIVYAFPFMISSSFLKNHIYFFYSIIIAILAVSP